MMSRFLKKTRQLVSLNLLRRILKSARSLEIFEIFFNPNFLRLKSKRLKEARKRSPRISKKKSPNCHFVSFLIILLFEKTKSLFFRCIYYVYLWNVAILKNKSIFGFKKFFIHIYFRKIEFWSKKLNLLSICCLIFKVQFL